MRISSLIILLACNTDNAKNSVDSGVINNNIDSDGDGFGATEDCNDSDPQISPQEEEICDGVDNNCDGKIATIPMDKHIQVLQSFVTRRTMTVTETSTMDSGLCIS